MMKDWIMQLCPAIAEWQAQIIYEQVRIRVLAEREACAKVCDFEVASLTAIDEPRPALAVGICAAVIRARG